MSRVFTTNMVLLGKVELEEIEQKIALWMLKQQGMI